MVLQGEKSLGDTYCQHKPNLMTKKMYELKLFRLNMVGTLERLIAG